MPPLKKKLGQIARRQFTLPEHGAGTTNRHAALSESDMARHFQEFLLNNMNMEETISAIDTITLRIPLDIWAPAPMSQGVPRPHVGRLYVRVTTSRGGGGWGGTF